MKKRSIWCRLGFHKVEFLFGYQLLMTGKNYHLCSRCGELMQETTFAFEGGGLYTVEQEEAREVVLEIEKQLGKGFKLFNRKGTKTMAEYRKYTAKLEYLKSVFMKYVGDWKPRSSGEV